MGSIIDAGVKLASGGLIDPDLRGSKAAGSALDAQSRAAAEASAAREQAYKRQEGLMNPYINGGMSAFANMQSGNMQMDPGYQFRLNEGNKAINNAASARGNAMGGGTMKALSRYGQDYASNEYGNAFNRQNQIANYGYNASNSLANFAGGFGNAQANGAIEMGNARAANQIGQANRLSNDIGQAVQSVSYTHLTLPTNREV